MTINKVFLSGNLTREPDVKVTQNGTSVLSFGMAVNERRKNQNGDWEDCPNFVDCVMFGNRAETVGKIIYKGMKVSVEGKLRYNSWEKDGEKRSKLEVVVDEIEFMSRSKAQDSAPTTTYAEDYQTAPQNVSQQPTTAYIYDEDLPFS